MTSYPAGKIEDYKQRIAKSQVMTFPSTLGSYFIAFNFSKYSRDLTGKSAKYFTKDTICLPIPNALNYSTAAGWQDTELETFGEDAIQSIIKGGVSLATGEGWKAALDKASKIADTDIGGFVGRVLLRTARNIDSGLGAAVEVNLGAIPNPHLALAFTGIGFRTHTFQWKLVATNRQESDAIRSIITKFQARMLPDVSPNNSMLTYPDVCDVVFSGIAPGYIFDIKRSVVTDVQTNYSPRRSGQ